MNKSYIITYVLLTLLLVFAGYLSYVYISGTPESVNIEVTETSLGISEMATNGDKVGASGNGISKTIDIEFTRIPSGILRMGKVEDPTEGFRPKKYQHDDQPEHDVLVKEFEISTYEITRAEYAMFVNAAGYRVPEWSTELQKLQPWMPDTDSNLYKQFYLESDEWVLQNNKWKPFLGFENYPVNLVSYDDCKEFAEWLGYRLPTEAEWEWAAAGTNDYKYPWGNTFNDEANIGFDFADNVSNGPEPIGYRPKDVSEFGVYDLGGNVMEWVEGKYASYPGSIEPFVDEVYVVNRGGSWGFQGVDQFTYSRFAFPRTGSRSLMHDVGCRLARYVS